MTEVQSWVLIGVFTTIMLGSFAAMAGYFRFSLTTSLAGVNRSIDLMKDALTAEISASEARTRAELVASEARTRAELAAAKAELGAQIGNLDRDVQALTRRVFGDDRA